MKRPDAVGLIAIYHFAMSIPYLHRHMRSPLRRGACPDQHGIGRGYLATVRDWHRPLFLPALCPCLPAGWHRAVAAVAVGSLGSHRVGCPFVACRPHLDGHRRADHLVSAAGRGEAGIWL